MAVENGMAGLGAAQMLLGRAVRARRHRCGLSIEALSFIAAMTPEAVVAVEAGRSNVTLRQLEALSSAMWISKAELLESADRIALDGWVDDLPPLERFSLRLRDSTSWRPVRGSFHRSQSEATVAIRVEGAEVASVAIESLMAIVAEADDGEVSLLPGGYAVASSALAGVLAALRL